MKHIFKTMIIMLVGLLALAACAPSAAEPASASTTGLYPPQDLSVVANTGKPQLLNAYADWCTTCQRNKPIVEALQTEFGDRIDFISLNIDLPETQSVREQFNITDRSIYVLIDAQGNEIERWYGFIDQETLTQSFNEYLAAL